MGGRSESLWRVVAFLWSMVASAVVSVLMIVVLIWGAIDVLYHLATGKNGMSSDSGVGGYLKRMVWWPINNLVYAAFGDGSLQWLP